MKTQFPVNHQYRTHIHIQGLGGTSLHARKTPPSIKRQPIHQPTYKPTDNQQHIRPRRVHLGAEIPAHPRPAVGKHFLVADGQRDIRAISALDPGFVGVIEALREAIGSCDVVVMLVVGMDGDWVLKGKGWGRG